MVKVPTDISELHELASLPGEGVLQALQEIDSDVLVIGAGGKMGFHLSMMLQRGLHQIRSKFRVIAISRFSGPQAMDPFHHQGIETIASDLTSQQAVESLPDSNAIFYLAGVKFGTSDNSQLLHQVNVELPGRIAERYLESRIVALSTGCVYPFVTPASGGSIETDADVQGDAIDPPGEYAISCVGRERAFAGSGALTSLIRLNYSVDLRYGVLVDLARKVLREEPIDVTTGFVNVIWQGDANAYIIRALSHAATPPFVVNVTGAQILRVHDVALRFAELFGKEAILSGKENETAWLSNSAKSHDLWGVPTVSEDELIEWVAAWLLRGGPILDKPTHFEIRDGRY